MYVYLSKKIQIPRVHQIHSLSWNTPLDYLVIGGDGGLLKLLRLSPHTSRETKLLLHHSLTSHDADVTLLEWNSPHERLVSLDSHGKIVIWLLRRSDWHEEMANHRKGSRVADTSWSPDGRLILIVYTDGLIVTGSVDGQKKWASSLPTEDDNVIGQISWSPDGRRVLIIADSGSGCILYVILSKSGRILRELSFEEPITHLAWHHTFAPSRTTASLHLNQLHSPSSDPTSPPTPPHRSPLPSPLGSFSYGDCRLPLAIVFSSGRIELRRSAIESRFSVSFDSELAVVDLKWDPLGSVLAVAGTRRRTGENVVQFYDSEGCFLCLLKISSGRSVGIGSGTRTERIKAISWEFSGFRMAIAIGSSVYFATLRPVMMFGVLWKSQSLVYRLRDRNFKRKRRAVSDSLVFWNLISNRRNIRQMNRILMLLVSDSKQQEEQIVVVVEEPPENSVELEAEEEELGEGENELDVSVSTVSLHGKRRRIPVCRLLVLNEIGSQIHYVALPLVPSRGVLVFRDGLPFVILASLFHVLILSPEHLGVVDTSSSFSSSPPLVHVNDASCSNVMEVLDVGKDEICSIWASLPLLLVARDSGKIHLFAVLEEDGVLSFSIRTTLSFSQGHPERIVLNQDYSRLSILDTFGCLKVYGVQLDLDQIKITNVSSVELERQSVSDFRWSRQESDLLCTIEKDHLTVFRDFICEEVRKSMSGYLLDFVGSEVSLALVSSIVNGGVALLQSIPNQSLMSVITNQDGVSIQYFLTIQVCSLRNATRAMEAESLEESYVRATQTDDESLWRILGERALLELNLKIALRAFVRLKDYAAIRFVKKRLRAVPSSQLRQALAYQFCQRYSDADDIYRRMDRWDLIAERRLRLGQWDSLLSLVKQSSTEQRRIMLIDRDAKKRCYENLGMQAFEVGHFDRALKLFLKAQSSQTLLLKCRMRAERYDEILAMIDESNDEELLLAIAKSLSSVGLDPSRAYEKIERFDLALQNSLEYRRFYVTLRLIRSHEELRHHLSSVQSIVKDYSTIRSHPAERIDLFVASEDVGALSSLLENLVRLCKGKALLQKKLAVHNAMLVRKMHQSAEVRRKIELSEVEQKCWKRAEAYHFLLMSCRLLFENDLEHALLVALRLVNYDAILPLQQIYALIALIALFAEEFGICSLYFSKLELLDQSTYQRLAIRLLHRRFEGSDVDGETKDSLAKMKILCSECGELTSEWKSRCEHCHWQFRVSVCSGRVVAKPRAGSGSEGIRMWRLWRCESCGHFALPNEASRRKCCALCHQRSGGMATMATV